MAGASAGGARPVGCRRGARSGFTLYVFMITIIVVITIITITIIYIKYKHKDAIIKRTIIIAMIMILIAKSVIIV